MEIKNEEKKMFQIQLRQEQDLRNFRQQIKQWRCKSAAKTNSSLSSHRGTEPQQHKKQNTIEDVLSSRDAANYFDYKTKMFET